MLGNVLNHFMGLRGSRREVIVALRSGRNLAVFFVRTLHLPTSSQRSWGQRRKMDYVSLKLAALLSGKRSNWSLKAKAQDFGKTARSMPRSCQCQAIFRRFFPVHYVSDVCKDGKAARPDAAATAGILHGAPADERVRIFRQTGSVTGRKCRGRPFCSTSRRKDHAAGA